MAGDRRRLLISNAYPSQPGVPLNNQICYSTNTGYALDETTVMNICNKFVDNEFVSNTYDDELYIGTLTFKKTIKTIPEEAFIDINSIESVSLPGSINCIGNKAFRGCENLKTVKVYTSISNNAFSINDEAFYGCSSLTDVTIPYYINNIGNSAFYNCTSIEHIVLPNTLSNIGSHAFEGCILLDNIELPSALMTLNTAVFKDCRSLKEISISNNVYALGESAFQNCTDLKHIQMPENIIAIEPYTFAGCISLETVTLHDNIYFIRDYAFSGCTSLKDIESLELFPPDGEEPQRFKRLPSGLADIKKYAFEGCSSLEGISLPNNITYIEEGTFKNCSSLKYVYYRQFTSIGDYAFEGCTSLDSFSLPQSNKFTKINKGTFKNCSSLKNITIPNNVTSIEDQAFYGCSSFTEVTIPDNITSFGSMIFSYCDNIKKATINNSHITATPYGIFTACKSLQEVNLSENITKIGDFTFWGCESLDIDIPTHITELGNSAFSNCYSMTKFDSDTVTKLGQEVFSGCTRMQNVYIKPNVVTIGNLAFADCPGTLTLKNDLVYTNYSFDNRPSNGGWLGRSAFETLVIDRLYDELTIGEYAFADLQTIKTTIIKYYSDIAKIGQGAFENCSQMEYFKDQRASINSIYALEKVKYFGPYSFKNCHSLKKIAINASVVGQYAFENCYNAEIELTATPSWTDDTIPNYAFKSCRGKLICHGHKDDSAPWHKSYVYPANASNTPSWINGSMFYEIVIDGSNDYIGDNAFASYNSLFTAIIGNGNIYSNKGEFTIGQGAFENTPASSIIINDSVTTIGPFAFKNCSLSDYIYVGKNVSTIGNYAFENCTGRLEINSKIVETDYETYANRPSVTSSNNCWLYNAKFDQIDIDDNVTKVGSYIFRGLPLIKKITLSNTIKSIGKSAFGETSIKHIEIPASVETIGDLAFYGCSSLTDVKFNEGLKTIGAEAFSPCLLLQHVILPNSVTQIGGLAFRTEPKLQDIALSHNMTSVPWSSFSNHSAYVISSEYRNILIGNNITVLDGYAFENNRIHNLYIPSNVTTIDARTFNNATIDALWLDGYRKNIFNGNLLGNINVIYVPASLLDTYKADTKCNSYNIQPINPVDNFCFIDSDTYTYIDSLQSVNSNGAVIWSRSNNFIVSDKSTNIDLKILPVDSKLSYITVEIESGYDFISTPNTIIINRELCIGSTSVYDLPVHIKENTTSSDRTGVIRLYALHDSTGQLQIYEFIIKQRKSTQYIPNVDEIKVMSFNLSVQKTGELSWFNRRESCYQMIREQHPTIIGFQETMANGNWTDLYNTFKKEGYDGFAVIRMNNKNNEEGTGILYDTNILELYDPSNPIPKTQETPTSSDYYPSLVNAMIYEPGSTGATNSYGNFWLSNPSTAPYETLALEDVNEPDRTWFGAQYRRVANWALFKHKETGKTICFINTHLDTRPNNESDVVNDKTPRPEEMQLIMEKFVEYGRQCDYWILTGDMNAKHESEEMKVAYEYKDKTDKTGNGRNMKNTRYIVSSSDRTDNVSTYNGFSASGEGIIDHILCSEGMTVNEYHTIDHNYPDVPYLSDHYPIYSIIKLSIPSDELGIKFYISVLRTDNTEQVREYFAEDGMRFIDWIYSDYYDAENAPLYGPNGDEIKSFLDQYGAGINTTFNVNIYAVVEGRHTTTVHTLDIIQPNVIYDTVVI